MAAAPGRQRRGRAGALAALLGLLAAAAGAEPGAGALVPGAAFGFEDGEGGRFELVLEGLGPDGRRDWRVVEGGDPGAPEAATISRFAEDAEGRMLELRQEGEVYRFEPHDCARTLGLCTFRMRGPDGVQAFERVTGRDGERWVYSLFELRDGEAEPVPVRLGSVAYDGAGVPVEEEWTDLESFETGRFRRTGGEAR